MKAHALVGLALILSACSGSSSSTTDTTSTTAFGVTGRSNSGTSASGGTSNTGSTSAGTTGTTLDCNSTCMTKATSCGAPQGTAQSECSSLCAMNPSQSELTCLSADSCADLGTNPTPCGIGGSGTSAGNTTGGNTTGTTASTTTSSTTGTNGCTSTTPYCDGDSVVTCDQGFPVSTTCAQGCDPSTNDCHHDYAECHPGFEDSTFACPAYCDQQSHSFNGVYFCSSYCGPNGECPSGTACAQEGSLNVCNPVCQSTCDCPVPAGYPSCSWQSCTNGVCG